MTGQRRRFSITPLPRHAPAAIAIEPVAQPAARRWCLVRKFLCLPRALSGRLPSRCGANRPFSRISRRTRPGELRTPEKNIPAAGDPRQAIDAIDGGRDRSAHRLDLRRAKGAPASSRAIFSRNSSVSMVISPTFPFSRAISSSRVITLALLRRRLGGQQCPVPPLRQPRRRDVELPCHQLQRLASQQPAHRPQLSLRREALPRWPAGGLVSASFLGALRQACRLRRALLRHSVHSALLPLRSV